MDTKDQDKIKEEILSEITKKGEISTLDLSSQYKIDHQQIVGIVKALEIKEVVSLEKLETKNLALTPDGKICLDRGSPDIQILKELKLNGPQTKKALIEKIGDKYFNQGFKMCMKSKSISHDKNTDILSLKIEDIPSEDKVQELIKKVSEEKDPNKYDEKTIKELTKNLKFAQLETNKYFKVKKGNKFDLGLVKYETDLTSDLLSNDKWEKVQFGKYNYNSKGKEIQNGALHRLLSVRTQIREIFLEQGFEEMPTNNFVESSFWNFDSLFQPQQHPSRDMHDTFFLKYPKYSKIENKYPEYFKRVKEMHEKGGFGSIGWKYDWSGEIAEKNILRTHTTAVSSRVLYKLAEDYKKTGKFTPKKYFSIDRVFRNESLDNTHLAEFHQIEGFIADYNLGLGHLLGTIENFFKRFGIEKLRFKPAYNPYTEPSVEIYAFHPVSKKWVEIGNSGIFRPEMLMPMGLPSDVNVIAWGFSLERPTMIHYHLENIRELFGHEVNIKHTQDSSVYYIKE